MQKNYLKKKIYVCGTLRTNRGLAKDNKKKTESLKSDQIMFHRLNHASIITWKDKRAVTMITTIHDNATTVPIERTEKKKDKGKTKYSKVIVNKPSAIVDYNKYMGGVDHFDQMIKYYEFIQKSQKWTRKMIFYLIQMAIHNSFVLYKKYSSSPKKLDLLGFQKVIYTSLLGFNEDSWPLDLTINDLVHAPDIHIELDSSDDENNSYNVSNFDSKSLTSDKKCVRTLFEGNSQNMTESQNNVKKTPTKRQKFNDSEIMPFNSALKHTLSIEPTKKRRQCRVCSKHKKRRVTFFRCESCKVHLCPDKCYSIYHDKDY